MVEGRYDDIGIALDALIRGGVIVRSSGNFDFDNDGETERWMLLRHRPQERLEFWVLARSELGVRALFIEQVDLTETRPYFHEPLDSPPIAQIGPKHGFVFARLPVTRQPYLILKEIEFKPTTFTLDALQSIIDDFFAGTNPAIIRNRLEDLEKSDQFNCSNYHICDRFYYTLGLAYELAGDIRPAIDTYIKLWWENTDSPFMLIGRLKLKQIAFKTSTPTTGAYIDTHPHAHTRSKRHAIHHAHYRSKRHADRHTHGYRYSHGNSYTYRYPYTRPQRYANRHAHNNRYSHGNSYTYRHPYTDILTLLCTDLYLGML